MEAYQKKRKITPCAPVGAGVLLLIASDEAQRIAGVAELADAYGSGPYGGNPMEVQVLSPAPSKTRASAIAEVFYFPTIVTAPLRSGPHEAPSA